MSKKSKSEKIAAIADKLALSFLEREQERVVQEFAGAMLSQLRLQPEWFKWQPSKMEMQLALSKAFVQILSAHAAGLPRTAQVASADLANLAMKCFQIYGK